MQYRRNVLILSIISVVLALTFIVGLIVKNVQSGPGPSYDFVTGLTSDNLASITVTHGGDVTHLSKAATGWYVDFGTGRIKAKASRVDDLVKSVLALKSTRTVSTSKSTHEEMKLTDELGYKLEISNADGSIKRSVVLGDQSPQGNEQFVRESTSDTVYVTAAGLNFDTQQKPAYWADKQAWPANIESGNAIEISYDSKDTGALIITKSTKANVDSWAVSGRPNIDQGALTSWIRGISTLEGDDIVLLDGAKIPAGYTQETIGISVKDATTTSNIVAYRPSKDASPWLVVSKDHAYKTEKGDEFGLLVTDWKVKADLLKK